jgi:hypothetical protein
MTTFGRWRLAVPIVAALALLAAPPSARANFVMTVTEVGGPSITIVDNDSNDQASNTGEIKYINHSFGDFDISNLDATSNRTTGGTVGALQINSIVAHSTGITQKTLTVTLGDTDFNFPGSTGSQMTLRSSIGGTFLLATAGDSFSFTSSADPNNGQNVTAVSTPPQTFTFGTNTQGSFNDTNSTTFTRTGNYSLTNTSSFTLFGGTSVQSNGTTSAIGPAAAVPEPASLALGAVGILLVGLRGWRARKIRA